MAFPTGHALVIGVGTYQNVPRLNVPVTASDAQELATVLQDPHYCGYPKEQVTLLHDDTATRDGILGALDDLAKKTTEGDTALIFYSGHGEFGEDNAYYMTTSDMRKNDQRKVVIGSAVKESDLLEKLRAIKARRLILLFNACHSGEISPVLGGEPAGDVTDGVQSSLPDNTAAAILATGEGRIIITACRENQFSFVGSGPHTIFGQALLDGLRGKGTSSNGGFISAFDLYTYVYYAVDRAVQKIPLAARKQYAGGVQQPELTVLKGVGPMPVALYKGASATLSDFDTSEELDEDTAVSRIEKKYSERMLRSLIPLSIGNTKTAGRDIVEKSAGRDIVEMQGNTNQAGRDLLQGNQFGGDFVGGDKVAGDKVMEDKRIIDTGGGDYAEGNIDKRQEIFVAGNYASSGSNRSAEIADRTLLQKLRTDLPANGSIKFIKEQSFGDSFEFHRLRDLIGFVDNWDTVDYEFLDKEIENKKRSLYTTASQFLKEVYFNTFRLDNGMQSIEKSWRYKEPERYNNAVNKMNGLADTVYDMYTDLIRFARNKMGD